MKPVNHILLGVRNDEPLISLKNWYLLLLPLITWNVASSQNFSLKNLNDSSSIEYAHVKYLNSIGGTYSDNNGNFEVPNSVDSILISNISFRDTIISVNKLDKNEIYLKENINILNRVVVTPLSEKRKEKQKTYYLWLNISSYEIGTSITTDLHDVILKRFSFPIKYGADKTIIRLNIYSIDNKTDLPNNLMFSYLIKDRFEKVLTIDLVKDHVTVKKDQPIFVSFELIGYLQDSKLSFEKYKKIKDSFGIQMIETSNSISLVRVKNSNGKWINLSEWGNQFVGHKPNFNIELESLANHVDG